MHSGVNSAAWLEFDSPDLSSSDAANVLLSISEYNMCDRAYLSDVSFTSVAFSGSKSQILATKSSSLWSTR
jgi:hypothetical protein